MARYSVEQVASLTGVPPATLRSWETRYAVVSPELTDSPEPRYDDADVARLQEMARLVADGAPEALAAAEVAAAMGPVGVVSSGRAVGRAGSPTAADLVRAARTFDQDFLDRTLEKAFGLGSFEHVVDGWLMPSLAALGRAWETGSVTVAGEHFVTATVLRWLAGAFQEVAVRPGAPVAVVALPAGARHELGLVAFATCLRRQGVDVRYLGADVPRDDLVTAVATLAPAAVVLGVPMRSDVEEADGVFGRLAGAGGSPSLRLFVGGSGLSEGTFSSDVTVLPKSLSEGAEQVAQQVAVAL